MTSEIKKTILLHICCGVCAIASIKRLQEENFDVHGLFYNPNIAPEDEYLKRKNAAQTICEMNNIEMSQDCYAPASWYKICNRHKNEKEGGRRCFLCIQQRLNKTFEICKKKKYDYFTSTLTISPHKNSSMILEMGKNIGKDLFLAIDFKKQDGFKKSIKEAKQQSIYRQNYCGCLYGRGGVTPPDKNYERTI